MTEQETQSTPASGWYEFEGGFRYWDGLKWTDHFGPPHPKMPKMLTQRQIASAVMVGVLAALFVVWVAAQISPEHAYLPVKFVVKELPRIP